MSGPGPRMQPLAALTEAARLDVRGVFTDIDDTLTTRGRLTAEAYAAMERLHTAGLLVIPITGRPAGWCDHIARMWPVDAVVGENGALAMRYHRGQRRLQRLFAAATEEREAARVRLRAVARRILELVPGTALASDQDYREADLAIDYCEDVPRLGPDSVERIVAIMAAEGMTAKVSSIHINGWFGRYDKLTMTRRLLAECFGVDLDRDRGRYVFIGDSPNDAPMFEYFPLSIGVANVREFAGRMPTLPAFVTETEAGAGFAEVVRRLLGGA